MCTNQNNIKNFSIEKLTKNWPFYIELKTDAKYTLDHILYNTVICEASRFYINPFLKEEERKKAMARQWTMTVWGDM